MSASLLPRVLAFVAVLLASFHGAAAAAGVEDSATSTQPAAMSTADKTCLAKVVMHEAGNQPKLGQMAVAQVVLNRLMSGRFGDTVCAVINQPGQFFNTARYQPSTASTQWRVASKIAEAALEAENRTVVAGALFFNATRERAKWRGRRVLLAEIGDHSFYR